MDFLYGPEHVERYRATDGEEGHYWRGALTLLLTTKGRKSGDERTTPLIYARRGDDVMIVASKGGSDEPPAWFLNIQDEPDVEVQIKGDKFSARARVATPEERPEVWRTMAGYWPDYDAYQGNTDREIPVVILERTDS